MKKREMSGLLLHKFRFTITTMRLMMMGMAIMLFSVMMENLQKTLSSLSLNAGYDDANDVDDDEVDIFSVRRPFPISAGVDICLGAPTTTTRY